MKPRRIMLLHNETVSLGPDPFARWLGSLFEVALGVVESERIDSHLLRPLFRRSFFLRWLGRRRFRAGLFERFFQRRH